MKVYLVVQRDEESNYIERAFSKRENADKYLTSKGFENDGEDYYFHPFDGRYTYNGVVIEAEEWLSWEDNDPRLKNVKYNNFGFYEIEEMEVESEFVEDEMINEYRRFELIGGYDEQHALFELIERKQLSNSDILTVLNGVRKKDY